MTAKPKRADWKRLGTAVQDARRRAGWEDMQDWADVVGRSTRVLLGLERGESTGSMTLRRIEELLQWGVGYADRILADPTADLAPELARPLDRSFVVDPPGSPRELDDYSIDELLGEINLRYSSLALELHNHGVPVMTSRQEGPDEVLEPMTPAERRRRGAASE